jgi:hypothetical protein
MILKAVNSTPGHITPGLYRWSVQVDECQYLGFRAVLETGGGALIFRDEDGDVLAGFGAGQWLKVERLGPA